MIWLEDKSTHLPVITSLLVTEGMQAAAVAEITKVTVQIAARLSGRTVTAVEGEGTERIIGSILLLSAC